MEIFRDSVLEAKHVEYNMSSLEIEKEKDEIDTAIDNEFVDFTDALLLQNK
jgi:hypothetical protein